MSWVIFGTYLYKENFSSLIWNLNLTRQFIFYLAILQDDLRYKDTPPTHGVVFFSETTEADFLSRTRYSSTSKALSLVSSVTIASDYLSSQHQLPWSDGATPGLSLLLIGVGWKKGKFVLFRSICFQRRNHWHPHSSRLKTLESSSILSFL